MNRDWLQIVSNLGVVAGLVFLGFQILQDREMKRADMIAATFQDDNTRLIALLGENSGATISKIINNRCLSEEEQTIAAVYYNLRVSSWVRNSYMQEIGLFGSDWHENQSLENSSWEHPSGIAQLEITAADPRIDKAFRDRLAKRASELRQILEAREFKCRPSDDA